MCRIFYVYHYTVPTPEDIFTKLNGGICFEKIDLSDAFLQIKIDEDFNELLTIGIKFVPALLQQVMDAI